jgi:uncharacterized protein YoxC
MSSQNAPNTMLDLEQTLKELSSFVKRTTDDKKENIQEILTRQKEINEDIHKIRKSLNDHLDQSLPNCSTFLSSSFALEIK